MSFTGTERVRLDAAVSVVGATCGPVAVAVVVSALAAAATAGGRRPAAAAATAAAARRLVLDERAGGSEDVPEAAVQVERLTRRSTRLRIAEIEVERPLVVGHDAATRRILVAAEQGLLRAALGDELRPGRQEHRRPDLRADLVARHRLAL